MFMKRTFAFLLLLCMLALAGCPAGGEPGTTSTTGNTPGGQAPAESLDFSGDFTVVGADAALLTQALEDAGVSVGGADATKKIIVGEDSTAPLATAKQLATAREGNYGDYAIVCDGTNLALYGGSEYATRQAVACLIADYVTPKGVISVPADLSYTHAPALSTLTFGSHPLKDFTVVSTVDGMMEEATDFAQALSALCGYPLEVSDSQARVSIRLTADTAEDGTPGNSYHVSCEDARLTISAADRSTLSAAISDFLAYLADAQNMETGASMDRNIAYQTVDADNTDTIKYCGTWQATDADDPKTMVSYWNAAYAEVSFTGHSITVEFAKQTTYCVKIDDGAYSAPMTSTGKVTFYAEGEGDTHTIRIYNNNRDRHMYLRSFSVEQHQTISRTPDRPHYIQFVGDSISDATTSFSHRVGDVLGWDFSVTALSGMALQTGYGYWKNNNPELFEQMGINVGMEDAFFRLGYPVDADYYDDKYKIDYSSGNAPDIVFIFLGTNDELDPDSRPNAKEDFVATYQRFVENIFGVYGEDTQIVILQALSTSGSSSTFRYSCIRAAAENLINLYPDQVALIDREFIEEWNPEISSDTTHPTQAGYDTLTQEIAAYLAEYYG